MPHAKAICLIASAFLIVSAFAPREGIAQEQSDSDLSASTTAEPATSVGDREARKAARQDTWDYRHDDGTYEQIVGLADSETNEIIEGADFMWLNAYQTTGETDTITGIGSAFSEKVPTDKVVTYLLYEDPNDDGDPSDANLLAQTEVTVGETGALVSSEIDSSEVEGTFFVAVLYPNQEPETRAATLDTTTNQEMSWGVGSSQGSLNINDLTDNDFGPDHLVDQDIAGNWILRAEGSGEDGAGPAVATLPAVEVTGTSARLRGEVDPKEQGSANVDFVYYTLNAGEKGTEQRVDVGTVSGLQEVSETVSGLETGQKYGYYVEAETGSGTATGGEEVFTAVESSVEFVASGPFEVKENASQGAVVGDVDATDGGGGPDAGIDYQITGGNDPDGNAEDAFQIDLTDGTIEVFNPEEIDFEKREQYFLTVKASSGEGVENSQETAIDISVLDAVEPPVNLTAEPNVTGAIGSGSSSILLDWEAPPNSATDISQYNIYRSTAPIPESADPSDLEPVATAKTGLTEPKVDTEPGLGQTYYYRFTTVSTSGGEGYFSRQARAFTYPPEADAQVERTFGQGSRKQDYRLIALPGQAEVETRPLKEILPGEEDRGWRAFWDDGTGSDYIEHDGSDLFLVEPGAGFWAISTEAWTDGKKYPAVQLEGDSAAVVSLHEGWNIVSNPTGKDVAWPHVLEENGLSSAALWRFDGTFTEADVMASARSGEAYYFLNDAGLASLKIPYPGSPPEVDDEQPKTTQQKRGVAEVILEATQGESSISQVRVQFAGDAKKGYGASDVVAPTTRFSTLGLRLENPASDHKPRRGYLATERRPKIGEGQAFDLTLWSRQKGPIQIFRKRVEGLSGAEVSLIVPSQDRSYDLRENKSVAISTGQDTTQLRLAIGSIEYVQDQNQAAAPKQLRLTTYPNPVRQQATLRYALPEEMSVRIAMYDVLGRKVAQVSDEERPAGKYETTVDVSRLSSGVYFVRMRASGTIKTRKVTVVR